MSSIDRSVILEFVNRIFLEYSPQYHHIKQLAERDVGQELIDEIKEFLEKRKKIQIQPELQKILFEDPSNVSDDDINSIVDAFIKMRSDTTLTEIERKSIDDILILFNQWIMIGKGQQDSVIPTDILSDIVSENPQESLEQQILESIQPEFMRDIPGYPESQGNIYSGLNRDVYSSLEQRDVYFGSQSESNPYVAARTDGGYKMQTWDG